MSNIAMAEEKVRTTYEGNCHCGNIRYTVTLPDALAPKGKGKVLRCNCSICTKSGKKASIAKSGAILHGINPCVTGYLLVYPMREDVVWLNDSESRLKDYFMGKKNKPHRFCPECGSSILIDFKNSDVANQRPRLAVSVSNVSPCADSSSELTNDHRHASSRVSI